MEVSLWGSNHGCPSYKRNESIHHTDPFIFAGAVAGICTGLIHVKCKVRDLLSGIIMMTALWTINLYIAGTANVPLFSQKTIFKNDLMDKIIPDALCTVFNIDHYPGAGSDL